MSFSLACSGAILLKDIAVSDPFLRGFLRGLGLVHKQIDIDYNVSKYFTLLQIMNAFFVMIVIVMIKTYRRYRFCT